MKLFILPLLLLFSLPLFSQVDDDFSDGNFTTNPTWTGDAAAFQINVQQLQLASSGTGVSYLATANSRIDSTEWNFWVRLNFSPSNQNNVSIYLVSDQQKLEGSLNGYLIKIGENGSDDAIDLVRQDGTSLTTIINGMDGRASGSNNELRIKVVRDKLGNWELYSDTTGGVAYVKEGSTFDDTYTATSWFGWVCTYTTFNATRFYLDDVYVGPKRIDKEAPELVSAFAKDATTVVAGFSEMLDPATVLAANFRIPGAGTVSSAGLGADGSTVELQLPQPLVNKTGYELIANNIADLTGNIRAADTAAFTYFIPAAGDVVINEIFPDFTPKVGLPEAEFLELYNTTAFPANLANWTISDGTSTGTFPNITLQPDSYLIVSSASDAALFQPYGKVAGLNSFPTLNNGGDNLILKDAAGSVLEQLAYTLDWYNDETKEDGGWTMERVNPLTSCGGSSNWHASQNPVGGTPGAENSVYNPAQDTVAPRPLSVQVLDSVTLQVKFSEDLDSLGLTKAYFSLAGITIATVSAAGPSFNPVQLKLAQPLSNGTNYTLSVSHTSDCEGNQLADTLTFDFEYFKPQPAAHHDVVINEILFDPEVVVGLPDAEYVELLNKSDKPISLKKWTFSDPADDAVIPDFLLLPDSFVVLAKKGDEGKFPVGIPVLGLENFPTLNNTSDTLFISDSTGTVIHAVPYQSSWMKDGLKEDGGWSLEMIDADNSCGEAVNWRGSIDAKGGTPGAANSIKAENPDAVSPEVLRVVVQDSVTLRVIFSEPMDPLSFSTNSFELNPNIGNPVDVQPQPLFYRSVLLSFISPLQHSQRYELSVKEGSDCVGNKLAPATIPVGLPEPADSFDLVLNELLFNPRPGGVDFIEIYNRSEKIIDLKGLLVSTVDENFAIKDPKEITLDGYSIFPGDYVVLTTAPDVVQGQYHVPNPQKMLKAGALPSMPNDEGTVVLLNRHGLRIDQFTYDSDMHFALLKSEDGVSLERIDPNAPTQNAANWFSAAATVGYATPTYRNSQFMQQKAAEKSYSIAPPIFSPDLDGFQDLLNISFAFDEPGHVVNIMIYDLQGRPVKELANNVLAGNESIITWDGIGDNGRRAAKGVYVVYLEIFDLKGNAKHYKESVTLAVREN